MNPRRLQSDTNFSICMLNTLRLVEGKKDSIESLQRMSDQSKDRLER
jgi:hypothetical protein